MGTEDYSRSDEWRVMAEEVIDDNEDLHWIRNSGVRIDYVISFKEKKKSGDVYVHAECKCINDFFKLYCPYDFVIVIYLPNIGHMSDEQKRILLYHELRHVNFKETKDGVGKYTIRPHDIEDFKNIITQFGMDWAE